MAPSVARSFVQATFDLHELDALLDTAQLLTSEAVTNAVKHAGTTATLLIQLIDDAVRISVTDGGFGQVALRQTSPRRAGGGRGLFIIDQMAARWGTRQTAHGTEVWFDLALP